LRCMSAAVTRRERIGSLLGVALTQEGKNGGGFGRRWGRDAFRLYF